MVSGTPRPRLSLILASGPKMVMRGGNEPLAKEKGTQNEQTYFRLSLKCRSHPRCTNSCRSPGRAGRRQQDHCLFESEDQQETSQQEIDCREQHHRQACREVTGDGDWP